MKNNIMLVGLPGSGKSSIAAGLAQQGWWVVSTDAVRAELTGDAANQLPWPAIWARCLEHSAAAATARQPVVYDATNLFPRYRRGAQMLAAGHWECWVVDQTLATCIARNATRQRQVPIEVITQMARQFIYPTQNEGFVKIRRIEN